MPRGDKNKRGSSGRGESNQSNQPFIRNNKQSKSNHNRANKGGSPSESEKRRLTPDSDYNRSLDSQQMLQPFKGEERRFNLLVDSVPYMVQATAFRFNSELRYRVSFNGSPEHVFTWDSSVGELRAIDDDSSTMPDNLELAISKKLQSKS